MRRVIITKETQINSEHERKCSTTLFPLRVAYIYNNNKLYLNTVATELMCFYKYSKNVFIHCTLYFYSGGGLSVRKKWLYKQ